MVLDPLKTDATALELRDLFAATALIGLLARQQDDPGGRFALRAATQGMTLHDVAARDAYAFADAMLKARQAQGQPPQPGQPAGPGS